MNKETFIEKYAVERLGTNSLKWDALDRRFGDPNLLAMWVADMEFRTPDEVIKAVTDRVSHGVYGYSYVTDSYYDSVIKWHENRHTIMILSSNGMRIVIKSLLKKNGSDFHWVLSRHCTGLLMHLRNLVKVS